MNVASFSLLSRLSRLTLALTPKADREIVVIELNAEEVYGP